MLINPTWAGDSGVDIPSDYAENGYRWETGEWTDEGTPLRGTFIYDNTQPQSWEDVRQTPVTEFTWSDTTHSGDSIQWSQEYTQGFGTEIFFTGGQKGQDWYALRFIADEEIDITERPISLVYLPAWAWEPPHDWIHAEFQWTGPGGQVNTQEVTSVQWTDSIVVDNTAPELFQASINGVNGDLVLDEKRGSYELTLQALARDQEGGVLSFTLDGEGPVQALATGANSIRASHSVTRTIPGQDTAGQAYEYHFEVEDPTFGWASETRTVTVRNLAPIIETFEISDPDRTKRELGELLAFDAHARDPGGDPLTYEWDLDGDGVYDDFTGQLGSTQLNDPNQTHIAVRVADGDGGYATESYGFVVPEPSTAGLVGVSALIVLTAGRRPRTKLARQWVQARLAPRR
jgi:hypothetical protein